MLCDQTVPNCNRCVKAGRHCEGYGTRLSWPRRNDPRRAVIGPAPAPTERQVPAAQSGIRLVNASSWDVELFRLVSTSTDVFGTLLQGLETSPAPPTHGHLPIESSSQTSLPLLKTPVTVASMQLGPDEMDLFQYCQTKSPSSFRCMWLTSRSCVQGLIFHHGF